MKKRPPNLVNLAGQIAAAVAVCALGVAPLSAQDSPRSISPGPQAEAPVENGARAAKPPSPLDEAPRIPAALQGLEMEEYVGQTLPLELQFTNAEGKVVLLGDYFKSNKPAVISMVYYKCPVVCDIVMQKVIQSLNNVDFSVGNEINCLFFSFDPTETTADAAASKRGHLVDYTGPSTPENLAGFGFHTSSDVTTARRLADSLGFKYRQLTNGEFGHPMAIYVITPDGKISRYFYGASYPPRDLKLAFIDASNGKLIRTIGERILSYCYMFDGNRGKYTIAAMRVAQVSGLITVMCVTALVGALLLGEHVRRRRRKGGAGDGDGGDGGAPGGTSMDLKSDRDAGAVGVVRGAGGVA